MQLHILRHTSVDIYNFKVAYSRNTKRNVSGKKFPITKGGTTSMVFWSKDKNPFIVTSACSNVDNFSKRIGMLSCIQKFIDRTLDANEVDSIGEIEEVAFVDSKVDGLIIVINIIRTAVYEDILSYSSNIGSVIRYFSRSQMIQHLESHYNKYPNDKTNNLIEDIREDKHWWYRCHA